MKTKEGTSLDYQRTNTLGIRIRYLSRKQPQQTMCDIRPIKELGAIRSDWLAAAVLKCLQITVKSKNPPTGSKVKYIGCGFNADGSAGAVHDIRELIGLAR